MTNTIPTVFSPQGGMSPAFPSAFPGAQQVVIPQITIPSPQPIRQVSQGVDLYRVRGMDGAKQFPTQPNSRYALFDEDEDVFYVKVTDQNNYPISLKRFCFIEEEEPDPNTPQYVTMEEFNRFKEDVLNGKQSVRSESNSTAAGK